MLGTGVMVPTLDGDSEVEAKPGTQPGDRAVLRGLGLPSLQGARRGDQHVFFNVIVPAHLSDDQRELAERLDATIGSENLAPEHEGVLGRVRRAFG
jgi:molecular chaperone DnaJ